MQFVEWKECKLKILWSLKQYMELWDINIWIFSSVCPLEIVMHVTQVQGTLIHPFSRHESMPILFQAFSKYWKTRRKDSAPVLKFSQILKLMQEAGVMRTEARDKGHVSDSEFPLPTLLKLCRTRSDFATIVTLQVALGR